MPSHLLRIELAATAMAVVAVCVAPDGATGLVLAVFLWCLVGLFYSDLLHFLLPDPLTLILFVAGLCLAYLDPLRSMTEAFVSAGLGVAAFALIRWGYQALKGVEGLGLGDVKLMAGLGAGLGWAALPWVTLIAAVLGIIATLAETRAPGRDTAVPFGTYLCASALVFLLFSQAGLTQR